MTTPTEVVSRFYDKLKAGDASGALGLMASDIEWITMWHYKVDGRGPERVAQDLFKPLAAEWSSFALVPTEFIADGDTVVSLGDFTGVHSATGKKAEARYAHVWTVKDSKIIRFRQYIDTLAVAEARRSWARVAIVTGARDEPSGAPPPCEPLVGRDAQVVVIVPWN